jgi:hypothetical protein
MPHEAGDDNPGYLHCRGRQIVLGPSTPSPSPTVEGKQMKSKNIAIPLAVALLTGLASLDAVAGKGGAGGGTGGGMPGMSGGLSKGTSSGGGLQDPVGMGGTKGASGASRPSQGVSKGDYGETKPRERVRTGEKDDLGVRTREADQAR